MFRVQMRGRHARAALIGVLAWTLAGGSALAADAGGGKGIYSCTGPDGKPILGDRRIPECMDREQKELNKDGSLRRNVPPPPTADERARMDAELERMREERATKDEAVKYDQLLKRRYPNQPAHDRARQSASERLRSAGASSEQRLRELAAERQKLNDEAEFYKGRRRPDRLRQQIDANEAAAAAQRQLLKQQQEQIDDMNRQYDTELDRLRKLWNGAPPGSVGPVPGLSNRARRVERRSPAQRCRRRL